MSWGALGIVAHAEKMGLYADHIQTWLQEAHVFLCLYKRCERSCEILGIDDSSETELIFGANTPYPVDDIERQLSELALALAFGAKFSFEDETEAEEFLKSLINESENRFGMSFEKHLKPTEILEYKFSLVRS